MSHWSQFPDQSERVDQYELRELAREASPGNTFDRRWYALALFAGLALVCMLGFSTSLFDSGPTELDVSAAYRSGFDQGTIEAEARWQEELEAVWWEQYALGRSEGSSMSPSLIEAVRDGFSWEGGYEAGLQSFDVDLDQSYQQGWMDGYNRARTEVAGESAAALSASNPPESGDEWGEEP